MSNRTEGIFIGVFISFIAVIIAVLLFTTGQSDACSDVHGVMLKSTCVIQGTQKTASND